MFEFRNEGRDNLLKAMNSLPRAMRNRAIRAGLRAGGTVIQQQAIENVKSVTSGEASGLLSRSIIVRAKKQRGKTLGVVVAIAKGIAANGARIGLYGSVLEHGKENQPPRPFLRPAARQTAGEASEAVRTESAKRLDEAVEAAKRGLS